MSENSQPETRGFQTEVTQLLKLMIHSLYSNKEIFLRELISNASDAADRMRFVALERPELLGEGDTLEIRVDIDKDASTLTIADNGIGMTREEIIENLGTIARSGTAEFLNHLTGDAAKDTQLIGQFGVGFYSAFIVADKVDVFSRSANSGPEEGVHWQSAGEGEFSVETTTIEERGTRIVLHLREDCKEFIEPMRIRTLIHKYSDHIGFPVRLRDSQSDENQYETVNSATALWTRSRTEIDDDEYIEFYKHLTHDFESPLTWSHNRVEGRREYTSLLYVPARAPFDLWNREAPRGLKLYVQRVFIMDNAEQFLPLYLRFMRGVIDSTDLPLNVSRELLQSHPDLDAMRSALTRRALDLLAKLAKSDPEKYQTMWDQFGEVIKEGIAEDRDNKERIAKLLRFTTTHGDSDVADQSLDDYLQRAGADQDAIYYIVADDLPKARSVPQIEIFRSKKIEVLLLHQRLDEWMIGHFGDYDSKPFVDICRDGLTLPGDSDAPSQDSLDEEHEALLERLKMELSDRVELVRVSRRLVDSPACLVIGEHDMGDQMRALLEASGQSLPESRPVFEINPEHPLIKRLDNEADDSRFSNLANVILDQARLADGGSLSDPAHYVQRLNHLLVELMAE